jgi:BirA family biotin operon repressor/biotin-[acetyl-CoA-carboxylase] ligase
MDQASVASALADLKMPGIRFFSCLGSTNDEAWRWIDSGAPHCSLVIADEQTAGRGRLQRRWVTPPGSALAFSIILRSPPLNPGHAGGLTGLGALAVCSALQYRWHLPAQIKWPNDVLINQRKVSGVLVEARWDGKKLLSAVIGIGINIAPQSISPMNLPAEGLHFPAGCVEDAVGHPVDRLEILHAVLGEFFSWLEWLPSHDFFDAWEANLAYRGQWVELSGNELANPPQPGREPHPVQGGTVIGIAPDGSLKLLTSSGELVLVQVGEIHLMRRPG